MAFITGDLVKDTSTTTGTGDLTLSGASVNGFQNFGDVCANNDIGWYRASHATADEWETGIFTYNTTGPKLVRTEVITSSNSGGAVNFSAGTKNIILTFPAVAGKLHANVKAFGAKGDGVTDDTAAIARADASGLQVFFPAGTYLVSSITCRANTHWTGILGAVTIKATSATATTIGAASGGTFENIIFDGDLLHSTTGTAYAVCQFGADHRVTGCEVKNYGKYGWLVSSYTRTVLQWNKVGTSGGHGNSATGQTCFGIYNAGPSTADAHMYWCDNFGKDTIKASPQAGSGFMFLAGTNIKTRGNIQRNRVINFGCSVQSNFIGAIDSYLDSYDLVISDNVIESYIHIGLKIGQAENLTCIGNTVIGVGDSGALQGISYQPYHVSGQIATLTKTAVIASNIVVGAQTAGITVQGNSTTNRAEGIIVKGNIVRSCGTVGIYMSHASNFTVADNEILSAGTIGIQVDNSGGTNAIRGNLITAPGGDGIDLRGDASSNVGSFDITENRITEFSGTNGIDIDRVDRIAVSNNTVTHSSGSGKVGVAIGANVQSRVDLYGNSVAITSGTADWSVSSSLTCGTGNLFYTPDVNITGTTSPDGSRTAAAMGLFYRDTSAGNTWVSIAKNSTTWQNLTSATAAQIRANTVGAGLMRPSAYWAALAEVALTDGATITPDFSTGINFGVTLGGNRTLANPTNTTTRFGQRGVIYITQDGTGSRTLSYGTSWEFEGGTAPVLSTTAGRVDMLEYVVRSSTSIQAKLYKDVR